MKKHRQLITKKENVKGGGIFNFEKETNTFTFTGESYEFGRAKLKDVKTCIESNNVFDNKSLIQINFGNSNFYYQDYTELIKLN